MAFRRGKGANDMDSFTVEAAIPLKDIGLRIKNGMLLKMDWGILSADESGTRVVRRSYWSNKATAMVSDAPTEARLHPDLWGYIRFRDQRPGKNDWMNDPMLLDPDLEDNEGMDGSIFELDF